MQVFADVSISFHESIALHGHITACGHITVKCTGSFYMQIFPYVSIAIHISIARYRSVTIYQQIGVFVFRSNRRITVQVRSPIDGQVVPIVTVAYSEFVSYIAFTVHNELSVICAFFAYRQGCAVIIIANSHIVFKIRFPVHSQVLFDMYIFLEYGIGFSGQ